MKSGFLIVCLVYLSFLACSTSKKTALDSSSDTAVVAVAEEQQDGSSFEKAVIIKEKSTMAGIGAEREWIRNRYPGSKKIQQALAHRGKKSYDIITIETENGGRKDIYFDITRFFGKF